MELEQIGEALVESIELQSKLLHRTVRIDFYQTGDGEQPSGLLLFNDGQELAKMGFGNIFQSLYRNASIKALLVAAIYSGEERTDEYGMSSAPNYNGAGSKAAVYEQFVLSELLPFISSRFHNLRLTDVSFAGFSQGALSALDISWNNPDVFSKVGVFSGTLCWRSVDKSDKQYDRNVHRLMHSQVRNSDSRPGMKFFFECGEKEEWEDKNRNRVIDSIDDAIDLMRELIKKGYLEGKDIHYLQLPDGKNDAASWARAMPVFLKWGWHS